MTSGVRSGCRLPSRRGRTSATAITGTYQDDFVHDYVGLLVFYDFDDPDGDGDIFVQRCSGTLLADKVTVVTAGHCVEGLDDGRIYWAQSVAPNGRFATALTTSSRR